jgi:hypothetical protein
MGKRKSVDAGGFKLPTPPKRKPLPAETVEAFATSDADAQAHELATSQAHAVAPAKASTSSQNRKGASLQRRKSVRLQAREDVKGVGRPRSGTGDQPYMRRDGSATRSTTIHLEVELHHKLRLRALDENRSMSEVVADAVKAYLT